MTRSGISPGSSLDAHSYERVPLGSLFAHRITAAEAIEAIVQRARSGLGGYLVTPNVDHVCVAKESESFREAHRSAYLSLVDGTPLMWLSAACGDPLPEKISGSDLIVPLCRRAASQGLSIALFGASEKSSKKAYNELLATIPGLHVTTRVCPRFVPDGSDAAADNEVREAIEMVKCSRPDIVFIAMGTPNQELFMNRFEKEMAPSFLCGIGAGLDFIAAERRRAPQWVQKAGLEWLVRLVQEPSRLWRRYLVRDRAIFGIAVRQIQSSRSGGKVRA
jgi:N-acetylglucosaminyldiphosphoundecaprenol N-acetyl-beta-D-mannosaminyltransferase